MTAYMVSNFEVADYDSFKRNFDSDPVGRKQVARGHFISRSVENPNSVFVRVEFASVEDAKSFRERLLSSGVLDQLTIKTPPTVVEVADHATY